MPLFSLPLSQRKYELFEDPVSCVSVLKGPSMVFWFGGQMQKMTI